MKKGKIILIIVWILILGGILIYSNNSIKKIKPIDIVVENESLENYEYIDYTGMYDTNDLKIELIKIDQEKIKASYLKISGLKNKKIENKINNKLYNLVNDLMDKGYKNISEDVGLNAFNILSIKTSATGQDNKSHYQAFNIDLTTGKDIKFEDVINTKNITGPISKAYYDTASFSIGARLNSISRNISMYNSCINFQSKNCLEYLGFDSLEDALNKQEELKNALNNMEDESLEYARNFDYNNFILLPEGISILDIDIHGIKSYNDMLISTKDNPKLFNYYYKYKDKDIFDGTTSGYKNLFMSDHNFYSIFRHYDIRKIEDYGIIEYTNLIKEADNKIINQFLDKYEKQLDPNVFTLALSFNTMKDISFTECRMSKDVYNNRIKKVIADNRVKSHYEEMSNLGLNDEEGVTCEFRKAFNYYTDILFTTKKINDEDIRFYVTISGLKDKNKEQEINDKIKNKAYELKNNNCRDIFMSAESIEDEIIKIKLSYKDSDNKKIEEIIQFDI